MVPLISAGHGSIGYSDPSIEENFAVCTLSVCVDISQGTRILIYGKSATYHASVGRV